MRRSVCEIVLDDGIQLLAVSTRHISHFSVELLNGIIPRVHIRNVLVLKPALHRVHINDCKRRFHSMRWVSTNQFQEAAATRISHDVCRILATDLCALSSMSSFFSLYCISR